MTEVGSLAFPVTLMQIAAGDAPGVMKWPSCGFAFTNGSAALLAVIHSWSGGRGTLRLFPCNLTISRMMLRKAYEVCQAFHKHNTGALHLAIRADDLKVLRRCARFGFRAADRQTLAGCVELILATEDFPNPDARHLRRSKMH